MLTELTSISDEAYLSVSMHRDIADMVHQCAVNCSPGTGVKQTLFLMTVGNSLIDSNAEWFFSNAFEVNGKAHVIIIVTESASYSGFEKYAIFNKDTSFTLVPEKINKKDFYLNLKLGGYCLKYKYESHVFVVEEMSGDDYV